MKNSRIYKTKIITKWFHILATSHIYVCIFRCNSTDVAPLENSTVQSWEEEREKANSVLMSIIKTLFDLLDSLKGYWVPPMFLD